MDSASVSKSLNDIGSAKHSSIKGKQLSEVGNRFAIKRNTTQLNSHTPKVDDYLKL
jgi:hypothetical protein